MTVEQPSTIFFEKERFIMSKNITMGDIAKAAGISKSAVSLALNNSPSIPKSTRERIFKLAENMGYVRNNLVSALMSNIKKKDVEKFSETIAVINGNQDEFALKNHPTLPKYFEGISAEAKRLGYKINEFWLHDARFNSNALSKVLRSRGIRGGIILGHSFGTTFPPSFKSVWKNFYFISVGIKTRSPSLEMVSADHYAITNQATNKAIEMNFKRPGLIIEEYIDELVDGRFLAGYMRAQMHFKRENKIPPMTKSHTDSDYAKALDKWIEKHKPDVILYLMNYTREVFEKSKWYGHIPLIQLEQRTNLGEWVGRMEQNNDIVGQMAMRRLADMLSRSSSKVLENANMVTLVPPTWIKSGVNAKAPRACVGVGGNKIINV